MGGFGFHNQVLLEGHQEFLGGGLSEKVNIDLEFAVAPFSSNSGSGQSGIWRLSSKLVESVIVIVVMVVMDFMVWSDQYFICYP